MEAVRLDYESERKRLEQTLCMIQDEFHKKEDEMIKDLIKYEREIEILKAKLGVVELIFGK